MKMFRSKSKIIALFCCFSLLFGCGLKGPLYQTPEKPIAESNKKSVEQKTEQKKEHKK